MYTERNKPLDFSYNYPQIAKDGGFKLRNYKDGPLDWHLIGSLEVERILKDQSLEQIDAVLSHISEVPLGSILDSNILDGGIAKYFILSQFAVQYLLFCRKFLEETVTELREYHGSSQMEIASLRKSLSEANNEILQLHKKITQMEAIHEVIYPCHLCTKNFVSNDALNLHISRKHNKYFGKEDKKSEVSTSLFKDRETDLALINTIKLELEIKQLKERLNNAEREIKEKNIDSSNSFQIKNIERETTNQIHVESIGIQSNLCDIKERDDNSEDDLSTSLQDRQQLYLLQEKLQDFERWKDEQKNQNSEFLTEINNKLKDFSATLELTKNQALDEAKLYTPTSIEDLETLLSKRIEDIGKANASKLEEVVNKIETNYQDKLDKLEKELKKINEKSKLYEESKPKKDLLLSNKQATLEKPIYNALEIVEENKVNKLDPDIKSEVEIPILQQKTLTPQEESSISNSNRTFVKLQNADHSEDKKYVSDISSENNSTDVSESFLDEEKEEKTNVQPNNNYTNKSHKLKETSSNLKKFTKRPRIVTKKEADKLTNTRLLSLGVDIKTNVLSSTSKKRISSELNENRKNLQQKYSQYNATRNKIKKFVDKLCSKKMPQYAENLLKVTEPSKPISQQIYNQNNEYFTSEDEIDSFETKGTTTFKNDSAEFKQRLERILESPIRKPDKHLVKAIVHNNNAIKRPIPIPRKRVMFNQPERRKDHLMNSLNQSKTDESSFFERHQEQGNIKNVLPN